MPALRNVFGNPRYALLFAAVSFVAFSVAVWLPNARLLVRVATESGASFSETLTFAFRLLLSIATNFTVLSATYTVAIALLIGANVALIIYLIRKRRETNGVSLKTGTATGALGIVSGALGIGCAACGTVILTFVLAAFGGIGALAYFPLRGGEFGIAGVFLLITSFILLAKEIAKPPLCYPK